jgi:hypothetical protein
MADSTFHEANLLTQTSRLPNTSTLRNRLAKASMSEAPARKGLEIPVSCLLMSRSDR